MNEENDRLVKLGICNRPHGIKGGFQFLLDNEQDSILEDGFQILLKPRNENSSLNSEGEEHTIKSIQFGNKTIVYLETVFDRNQVESMLPFEIYVPRSSFPEASAGEIYLNDLIGFKAIDEKGKTVGTLTKFYDNSAQTVLFILGSHKNYEIPFVDAFVKDINVEAKEITIVVPEFV